MTNVDLDIHPLPEDHKDYGYYRDYINNIERVSGQHDKKAGRGRWLQGQALIRAREASQKKGWGKWTAFMSDTKTPRSTAYACIRAATVISEADSHTLSWSEMLRIAYHLKDDDKTDRTAGNSLHGHKMASRVPKKSSKGLDKLPNTSKVIQIDSRSESRELVDSAYDCVRHLEAITPSKVDAKYCQSRIDDIIALATAIKTRWTQKDKAA